ncbi:c-type cytochrome [Vreelandella aquamarina]|uniref:c-type cytochrome n=1 Tax=Vreelandella aquamarina TaxID=77097 RepID=UPI00384E08DB
MKSKLIMSGLAALGVMAGTSGAYAQDAERDAIAERLAPVGQLCLQGQDCGTAAAPAAASSGGGDEVDGEGIYNNVCMACHETGAAGAPVRGDEAAWAERTEQGFATLLDHAINGIGAMPARGGNPNLSDEEVEAAVAHLVSPVMEVPELGGGEEAAAEATDEGSSDDMAANEAAAEAPAAEEAAASDAEATGGDSGLDGEALYASVGCAACHGAGVAGAPKLGDAEAWGPRIEQGKDALYQSVFNGKGAMPPRGGSSASDEEIMAVVDYMVSQVQ